MEQKSMHYWTIHKRVALAVLADLHPNVRTLIASDAAHVTDTYLWFAKKVAADAQRIYEDENHRDNQEHTFRINPRWDEKEAKRRVRYNATGR